jgi:hypothetical protein
MELLQNEIRVGTTDPAINAAIASIPSAARNAPYAMRFNQNEEYFLELGTDISVPSFPIHHDVRTPVPKPEYALPFRELARNLIAAMPGLFRGLSYCFDPAEILKPCFYKLYKVQEELYLYLLRIDLLPRPFDSHVVGRGDNDRTASYTTRRIFVESDLIPLAGLAKEGERLTGFRIRQLVSQTWIGESGKGYTVRGIWMDADLTKFFSKLFLPAGLRVYPFYPLACKYKTVCGFVPVPEAEARKRALPQLHRAAAFLAPEMERVQRALRETSFTEALPDYVELRARVPDAWREAWREARVEAYLNDRDMKEFLLAVPEWSSPQQG